MEIPIAEKNGILIQDLDSGKPADMFTWNIFSFGRNKPLQKPELQLDMHQSPVVDI